MKFFNLQSKKALWLWSLAFGAILDFTGYVFAPVNEYSCSTGSGPMDELGICRNSGWPISGPNNFLFFLLNWLFWFFVVFIILSVIKKRKKQSIT